MQDLDPLMQLKMTTVCATNPEVHGQLLEYTRGWAMRGA